MNELAKSPSINSTREVEIHPLAVVSPKAEIKEGVVIGPGAVIGPDVKLGPNTIVGPNVILDGNLRIGSNNKIFPGACIGLEPQDLKYQGASTEVIIGEGNTIRECVTINRATEEGEDTRIGDGNLIMAYCHLGHNCKTRSGVVLANSIQVAGHVVIEDKAVIGGSLGIHQFVHIGSLAMVGGMTRVDRDVPPYSLAEGHPGRLRGLNRVGLKRSGFDRNNLEEFRQLQETWRLLFRSDYVLTESLKLSREKDLLPASDHLCIFMEAAIQKGRRGPMPFIS